MSFLKFFVEENGTDFPLCHMSAPEMDAIEECVDALCPEPTSPDYWFEVDTLPELSTEVEEEEEVPYGVVWCYKHNPNPKNGSVLESRLPHTLPDELIHALSGKSFVVHPRQLGLNPWGKEVRIRFEELVPKKGIKASDLIAAALRSQVAAQ
jgi:hypothetical protein